MISAAEAATVYDLVEADQAVRQALDFYVCNPNVFSQCTASPRTAYLRRAITPEARADLIKRGFRVEVSDNQTAVRW